MDQLCIISNASSLQGKLNMFKDDIRFLHPVCGDGTVISNTARIFTAWERPKCSVVCSPAPGQL
ncbi:hypothetical protein N7537_003409 [Penicillium hordei]|uniref:Uncharacterized protein n=1 Tax=Penicillium hordei TaxID=40994 RepID=A0AAD6EAH2_9EURO|nr:uncharacterized protein N7537_003409 [Penicillium hordei]KAJ5606790.1 hypothetical protein N7537_003409 [Penicillium hordei]